MLKLFKCDLKRVLKDKLFLVVCILGGAFALVTPLLYWALFSSLDPSMDALFGGYTSAKTHFFGAFSVGNNLGLIVPILLAIILRKDFSHGTVRNKIISGHSRVSIFLSMYTVCFVVLWIIMLLHALLTLCISLIFFNYQAGDFGLQAFAYLLESLFFEMLVYLFVAAFVSWLCASAKNVGLVIVLYVGITFVLSLISGILTISIELLKLDGTNETLVSVLSVIQRINVLNSAANIGSATSYTLADVLYNLLPPLLGTGGLLGLGILGFKKKDLK